MAILLNKTGGKEAQFKIKFINTVNINAFSIFREYLTDNCSCELSAVLKMNFPKVSLQKMSETTLKNLAFSDLKYYHRCSVAEVGTGLIDQDTIYSSQPSSAYLFSIQSLVL